MPLTKNDVKKLKIGKVYKVVHSRKGTFTGQLIAFDDEPFRLGDLEDHLFLTFKYDVRPGTTQEHLNKGVKEEATGKFAPVRVSNLRPSLIESITETKEGKWLLDVKVQEEVAEPKLTIKERLLGRKE